MVEIPQECGRSQITLEFIMFFLLSFPFQDLFYIIIGLSLDYEQPV